MPVKAARQGPKHAGRPRCFSETAGTAETVLFDTTRDSVRAIDGAGFQPFACLEHQFMGRCPMLVWIGTSALKTTVTLFSTEGAIHTSLGHRPRKVAENTGQGCKPVP
jgi:hypothetical protein